MQNFQTNGCFFRYNAKRRHWRKTRIDSLDVDFVTADMLLKEADCFAFGPVFPFSTEGGRGYPFFPSSWSL
ncbi:hypothetical protein E4T50_00347 [Aureobasidium sp. EXF-12298]|nr:hypothetical protein E4T50_00347 [Aureobasidium sp. EXF-12298]